MPQSSCLEEPIIKALLIIELRKLACHYNVTGGLVNAWLYRALTFLHHARMKSFEYGNL